MELSRQKFLLQDRFWNNSYHTFLLINIFFSIFFVFANNLGHYKLNEFFSFVTKLRVKVDKVELTPGYIIYSIYFP